MRSTVLTDEFAQSVYEYKVRGKDQNEGEQDRRIGVDLVKFYDLKLNQQQGNAGEKMNEEVKLNMVEKLVLRLINIKVNFKFRYSM